MPESVIIITLIIMEIMLTIIMDTTEEPDTKSAGLLQMLFSKVAVFILLPVKSNQKKTLCG